MPMSTRLQEISFFEELSKEFQQVTLNKQTLCINIT